MDISAVQFGRVGLAAVVVQPRRNSPASTSAEVSRRDQGGEEHQENLYAEPLSVKQSSVKIQALHSYLYKQDKLRTHHSSSNSIYTPPNITCPLHVLPQHVSWVISTCIYLSWHHSANQPESAEVARNCSIPPEDFWCVSFYEVPTNGNQLHNVRWTNTCVSLAVLGF